MSLQGQLGHGGQRAREPTPGSDVNLIVFVTSSDAESLIKACALWPYFRASVMSTPQTLVTLIRHRRSESPVGTIPHN